MSEKIVLEIGANNGDHTALYYSKFKIPIYSFEPVPKNYNSLVERFKRNSNIHLYDYAIDLENGVKNFYISGEDYSYGCSSLYQFTENINELWKNRSDFTVTNIIEVKTIRLDEFLARRNLTKKIIEYLHCDAQGNDLNVLISLDRYIRNVQAGRIEVASNIELYKDTNNTIEQACRFLLKAGFSIKTDRRRLSGEEADLHFWRT